MNHGLEPSDVDTRHPSLPPLPVELLVRILMELHVKEMLKCRLVARSFDETITRSVALQYRIELAIASYVDIDTSSHWTTAEKLSRLRCLQANWDNMTYSSKMSISLPEDASYDYNGGFFALANNKSPLDANVSLDTSTSALPVLNVALVDLPSTIRDSQHQHRVARTRIEENLTDFMMDTGQDLLVILQNVTTGYNGPWTGHLFRIFFRTLSTSMHHPEAKFPYLDHHAGLVVGDYPIMKIFEDKVAILFDSRLTIWNWKSGCVIRAAGLHVDAFAFIDTSTIAMVACRRARFCLISLLQEDLHVSGTTDLQCQIIVALDLPPVRAAWFPYLARFQSHPAPKDLYLDSLRHVLFPHGLESKPPLRKTPFKADPSEHIVSFVVTYYDTDDVEEVKLYFMIRSSTLQRYALEGRVTRKAQGPAAGSPTVVDQLSLMDSDDHYTLIPPSEWAPYARCFLGASTPEDHTGLEVTNSSRLDHEGLRAAFLIPNTLTSTPDNTPADPRSEAVGHGATQESLTQGFKIRVFDFNPVPIKRALASSSSGGQGLQDAKMAEIGEQVTSPTIPPASSHNTLSGQTIVTKPDCIACPELFGKPFVCGSKLPFRYVTSEDAFSGVTGVVLDDERVIGVDFQSNSPPELTVLTM